MPRSHSAFDRKDDETERNFEVVQMYFEGLGQIEEIEPVLMVVNNVPLTITSDFKSTDVYKMLLSLKTNGICRGI